MAPCQSRSWPVSPRGLLGLGWLASAAARGVTLVTFDGAASTIRQWKEVNDPVMGGRSTGTFVVRGDLGVFDGEVVDVPFLKAPGFIKAMTADSAAFPDISGCTAIDMIAKTTAPYAGYRLSFGNAKAPGGKFFASGYKANFTAPVGALGTISVPIKSFTDYWDDATGNPIKTCQDSAEYCPDQKTLQNLKTISVWAEGVRGKIHLEILSISASGCSGERAAAAAKMRICPAIPESAAACPLKNQGDPEFEAVCVLRAQPAEIQQRRCMPGTKMPYYRDSQGVFRCACCGAPLWAPSVQFDQQPAEQWPWPSFHSPPLNGEDGLPNVCHRGPGYGTEQRNATADLGLKAVGEVGCARCGAHLGDWFNNKDDHLHDGDDHYCINGVCMSPPGGKAGEVCKPTTPQLISV